MQRESKEESSEGKEKEEDGEYEEQNSSPSTLTAPAPASVSRRIPKNKRSGYRSCYDAEHRSCLDKARGTRG